MPDHKTLPLETAIGRFGVTYVRKVCAQAHVGFSENDPDEDVLAVDGAIALAPALTRVQVKTSTHYSLRANQGTISLKITPAWREKWRVNLHPAYLILVLLERNIGNWFRYGNTDTLAGAYALWTRIDNLPASATHVYLNRTQRFTAQTVRDWSDYLYSGYEEDESA